MRERESAVIEREVESHSLNRLDIIHPKKTKLYDVMQGRHYETNLCLYYTQYSNNNLTKKKNHKYKRKI